MEKSAILKRLKKRCLCMVLSLLLAFGFAANEAFGFEFPLDADEPILNETEIALSEKVMNLELAVRTMKTKKKNVKVVVQPSAELEALIDEAEAEAEGYEIYYKFCRSVRKHSRYITWRTHEKNVYVNKEGVRGKKYYYKVRVILYVRYGNDHFKIAESELKQCRYGVRTWTK